MFSSGTTLRRSLKLVNIATGSALVNTSATCSDAGTYPTPKYHLLLFLLQSANPIQSAWIYYVGQG